MIRIRCLPLSKNAAIPALDVEWDASAGTVTGPGADYLRSLAAGATVPLHPQPATHVLGADPFKSPTDMAALVGWLHHLPEPLAASYPAQEQPDDVAEVEVTY